MQSALQLLMFFASRVNTYNVLPLGPVRKAPTSPCAVLMARVAVAPTVGAGAGAPAVFAAGVADGFTAGIAVGYAPGDDTLPAGVDDADPPYGEAASPLLEQAAAPTAASMLSETNTSANARFERK
jgi:hypothetical protein